LESNEAKEIVVVIIEAALRVASNSNNVVVKLRRKVFVREDRTRCVGRWLVARCRMLCL